MSLPTIFSRFSTFGFSGSRSSVPSALLIAWCLSFLRLHLCSLAARGVDEFFRSSFPSATVLQASSFGSGRGAFAARSVAVVRAVAAADGLWVCFPSSPCPAGLLPSRFFFPCFLRGWFRVVGFPCLCPGLWCSVLGFLRFSSLPSWLGLVSRARLVRLVWLFRCLWCSTCPYTVVAKSSFCVGQIFWPVIHYHQYKPLTTNQKL
jgi:hypothetical protein